MTTDAKVNVNTVHLVPVAAVWQAPKIILALLKVGITSFWTLFFLISLGFVLSHTTFFNGAKRAMMEDYEMCISTFKLNPDFTSRQEALAIRKCYAEAKRRSLLAQSR